MQTQSPGLPATLSPIVESLGLGNLPRQLDELTAARLQLLPIHAKAELAALLDLMASAITKAKGQLNLVLAAAYGEHAKADLLASGRDTGTTHLFDGDFDITVEIGKDVKWDAKGLSDLVAKIEATGGDPREYVEVKYSVSEAKFKAWPQTLRAPFEALRTVTPKAAKFVLRRQEGGAA